MNQPIRATEEHNIEARLAATFAAALRVRADQVTPDVATRLRFAREQALQRAADSRPRQAIVAVPAGSGNAVLAGARGAALGGFVPLWQRLVAVVPLFALVAGLVFIDHWSVREQVVAAADIDTELLSDDLPPSAYTDPGFAEFLKSSNP
jgi:hypothetical protein